MHMITKAEWIEALRSGKYKQAKGALCRINKAGEVEGFCCLGVAADLMEVRKIPSSTGKYMIYSFSTGELAEGYIPRAFLADILKLDANHDYQRIVMVEGTLINMNDTQGNSFNEIADFLESV